MPLPETLVHILSWIAYLFFLFGSLGGLIYLIRFALRREGRVEVHHRYHQVPVYIGTGRPGDMGHADPDPENAA